MKTLLALLLSVALARGATESVQVDSTTRDVKNTGVINYASGQLRVNDIAVQGGAGGGGGGGLVDGDYTDITVDASGTRMTIDPKVVSFAKMQDVTGGTGTAGVVVGRNTAGSGVLSTLTFSTIGTALYGSFNGSFTSLSGKPTTIAGYGITDAASTANLAPAIIVRHKGGSSSSYQPVTDTDVARGTALTLAVTSLVNGDTLEFGAGTFDLGTGRLTFPDAICTIRGSGSNSTTIISNQATAHAVAKPGTGNTWQGFKVVSPKNPVGWNGSLGQTTATTCTMIDIAAQGEADAFHFIGNTDFALTMHDCVGFSTFDVVAQTGSGFDQKITSYNGKYTSVTDGDGSARAIHVACKMDIFGGELTGDLSGGGTPAATVVPGGNPVNLFGVKVRSIGTNQYDIDGVNAFVSGGSGSGAGGSFTIATGTVSYVGGSVSKDLNGSDFADPAAVRTNIGAAKSGVNTDITSFTTTAMSTMFLNGIGALPTAAFALDNVTPATSVVQQNSPLYWQRGKGWAVVAGQSRTVGFGTYVVPVIGDVPTGVWTLDSIVNTTRTNAFKIFSGGVIQPAGGYNAVDGSAGISLSTGGLTIKNGLVTAGTITGGGGGGQPLDADLTSLAAASSTNVIYYRSAADTWSPVTIGANLTFSTGVLSATGGGGGGGSVATDTIFDAKGDLAVGTGADTADNLAVGANGAMLLADSGATTGVKWGVSGTDFIAVGGTVALGKVATATGTTVASWQYPITVFNKTGAYTLGTTSSRELYGGIARYTAAGTLTLPPATTGQYFTVMAIGPTNFVVNVDPDITNIIVLDGMPLGSGDKITSPGVHGDMVVCNSNASGWDCMSNGWTDTD